MKLRLSYIIVFAYISVVISGSVAQNQQKIPTVLFLILIIFSSQSSSSEAKSDLANREVCKI